MPISPPNSNARAAAMASISVGWRAGVKVWAREAITARVIPNNHPNPALIFLLEDHAVEINFETSRIRWLPFRSLSWYCYWFGWDGGSELLIFFLRLSFNLVRWAARLVEPSLVPLVPQQALGYIVLFTKSFFFFFKNKKMVLAFDNLPLLNFLKLLHSSDTLITKMWEMTKKR